MIKVLELLELMSHSDKKLPYSENAVVYEEKLSGYLMNDTHMEGKSKAKFFKLIGFTEKALDELKKSLLEHAKTRPVIGEESTKWGNKYVLSCDITSPSGTNPCIISVWMLEGNTPRFITAYPD